jgi:hypothetical protein
MTRESGLKPAIAIQRQWSYNLFSGHCVTPLYGAWIQFIFLSPLHPSFNNFVITKRNQSDAARCCPFRAES